MTWKIANVTYQLVFQYPVIVLKPTVVSYNTSKQIMELIIPISLRREKEIKCGNKLTVKKTTENKLNHVRLDVKKQQI